MCNLLSWKRKLNFFAFVPMNATLNKSYLAVFYGDDIISFESNLLCSLSNSLVFPLLVHFNKSRNNFIISATDAPRIRIIIYFLFNIKSPGPSNIRKRNGCTELYLFGVEFHFSFPYSLYQLLLIFN